MSVICHPAIPAVITVWTTVGCGWDTVGCVRASDGNLPLAYGPWNHGKRRGSEKSKAQQATADCKNDSRCAPDELEVVHGRPP